jgi:hypothetical protein
MIKNVETGLYNTKMVTHIQGIGKTIKCMDMGNIFTTKHNTLFVVVFF